MSQGAENRERCFVHPLPGNHHPREGADLALRAARGCPARPGMDGDRGHHSELRCLLQHPPPCSNDAGCFIISAKINYLQGEFFITLNIPTPGRAERHPSPCARQEASGTKLFSILSPCKRLHKLLLNSLRKNSPGELGKTPLWRLACERWSAARGAAVRGGALPDTHLHPQPPAQRPRGALRRRR